MAITRQEILTSLQGSLLGEIYPSIRAIAFNYDSDKKSFLLRYYLDREPTNDDYENASSVAAEFLSDFPEIDKIEEECVYSLKPFSELDKMDGLVFARKEN